MVPLTAQSALYKECKWDGELRTIEAKRLELFLCISVLYGLQIALETGRRRFV